MSYGIPAIIACIRSIKPSTLLLRISSTTAAQKEQAEVLAALEKLYIQYAAGEGIHTVTQKITLPAKIGNVTVTWKSEDTAVITATGIVTRGDSDKTVKLTAILEKGSARASKDFNITVLRKGNLKLDTQAVQAAMKKLAIGYAEGDSQDCATQNLTLPSNIDGVTVTWKSSNSSYIDSNGTVTRPSDGDPSVTLTATLTKNAATDTKAFHVTVKGNPEEWIDKQLNNASVSPTEISRNDYHITLSGSNVSWTSSDKTIIIE